jgi:hypothetical protein
MSFHHMTYTHPANMFAIGHAGLASPLVEHLAKPLKEEQSNREGKLLSFYKTKSIGCIVKMEVSLKPTWLEFTFTSLSANKPVTIAIFIFRRTLSYSNTLSNA